jgi:hypothetical protein
MTEVLRCLRPLAAVVAILAGVAVLPACGSSQFQFVADHRLHITAPRQRSTVSLPVTVRWRYDDFNVKEPDGGSFAVFVDHTPIPGGKTLAWLARNDQTCKTTPGCPDPSYFTSRQIFSTDESEMTFKQLPAPGHAHRGPENHTVTVVLLDHTGQRVGESAWYVDFTLKRQAKP